MTPGFRKHLKAHRLAGMLEACGRLFDRVIKLLEIPAPDAPQWLRRVTVMEKEIMLPIKAAGILMIYSFFLTRWIGKVNNELDIEVEALESFFWVYVGVNVVVASLLLALRRLPLALTQWMVFVSILVDGIFLSALTVVTGGHQSFLYWLFLGLIIRSAVSVPRATSQILLNLTIIACYVLAGVIEISIASNLEEEARATVAMQQMADYAAWWRRQPPARSGAPAQDIPGSTNLGGATTQARRFRTVPPIQDWEEPSRTNLGLTGPMENPAEPLIMRLVLLVLMTLCAYGVQVLLERQRHVEEEAREFGLREGQLHSAGRLAAEFAHQIKNPLAIINNAVYSLQRALKDGKPDVTEQLRMIREEVEHSDRIITQVMDYAQLTEGHVEKLNLLEELNGAIERVFPAAAGFPVRVHREYGPSFPPMLMQRRHLSETFINVLQNAREALAGKNGNLWVRAQCRPDYAVEVSIRDDGPGIPADKQEKIFDAYYTTKEKGTGLGLATVKHNVELYGGTVRVESELGKGALFRLVFPARTPLQAAKTN